MKKSNQVRINDYELEMMIKALEVALIHDDLNHWIYNDMLLKLKREESKRAKRVYI